jgi:hypothetical protein
MTRFKSRVPKCLDRGGLCVVDAALVITHDRKRWQRKDATAVQIRRRLVVF